VPVVFLIAIVAVLVGIFFAATGRGGELAYEHADHAPLDLGPVSAADVALLRPPTALWGYNMQVTDEALDQIARAMRERDVTIAYLQERLSGVEHDGSYAEPGGVPARQPADSPVAPGLAPFAGLLGAAGLVDAPAADETSDAPRPAGPSPVLPPAETADLPSPADTAETSHPLAGFREWDEATPESLETPESPETSAADLAEAQAPHLPEAPAVGLPEPQTAGPVDPPEAGTAEPPQTPLILKASPAKEPPEPEPGDATQPPDAFQEPEPDDATQPSEVRDPTQPSAALTSDDTDGPQGDFNAHGWWAEQREAARQEDAGHPAETGGAAETGGSQPEDPMAAAEEQSW
jgi:hypothetical protein